MLRFIPADHDDPPPFERIDGTADAGVLLVCDHASAIIPAKYSCLGLCEQSRFAHVAWDIGAAQVTRRLAGLLHCPAVLAGVSRLVIDCNRLPGDPTSIPVLSGGFPIPGNQALSESEADLRAEDWFWPYHREIATQLGHLWRRNIPPALVSVHSFTPVWEGQPRPWHVGVLSNRDRRMAGPVLRALNSRPEALTVGDNQPYSGRQMNYTLDTHAGAAGLPHVSIEIRQDLVADPDGAERWALLLAQVLRPILATADLHRVSTA